MTTPVGPLLRWAGSKQRLLPALQGRMPKKFNRYYEPFAGSACLFFAAQPRYSTLSDINLDLIGFYKQLRDQPEKMFKRLHSLPRHERSYFNIRTKFATETAPEERAVMFWFLNRHCFNGLFRTNRQGIFNVPYGSKIPPLPSLAHVHRCANLLKKSIISHCDFETALESAGDGDFIYLDPPYERGSVRDRGEYGRGAMQDNQLGRLLQTVKAAESRGAKILISYNANLSNHLPNWNQERVNGRYLISADSSFRKPINEYTIFNYSLTSA